MAIFHNLEERRLYVSDKAWSSDHKTIYTERFISENLAQFLLKSTKSVYCYLINNKDLDEHELVEAWNKQSELLENNPFSEFNSFMIDADSESECKQDDYNAFILLNAMVEEDIDISYQPIKMYLENHNWDSEITEKTRWVWVDDDLDQFYNSLSECINAQFDSWLWSRRDDEMRELESSINND